MAEIIAITKYGNKLKNDGLKQRLLGKRINMACMRAGSRARDREWMEGIDPRPKDDVKCSANGVVRRPLVHSRGL